MTGTGQADFDLHGVVGIRVVDATWGDLRALRRQLGPIEGRLAREPDITIRFVERLTAQRLTHVALNESGFNDDGFFVTVRRGGAGEPKRARIPFDRIGEHPEILVEHGAAMVPHLLAVINLTALSKGVLALHASAFAVDSTGVLVTGWAKSGKTESFLGCLDLGATYIGDEWVYLSVDGSMRGLPEPIRLWAWHLEQLPDLLASRSARERWRLRMWARAAAVSGRLGPWLSRARLPGADLIGKAAPIVARQAYLQIPPAEIVGRARMPLQGQLDAVVLVESGEQPFTRRLRVSGSTIAGRMAASLADERSAFLAAYRQFRFAYPDAKSAVVEAAEAIEADLLVQILHGRRTMRVLHPYPCDIRQLGRAVLDAAREATVSNA